MKFARSLLSSKERKEKKHFLIEGVRLVREAIGAGVKPRFVFYTAGFKTSLQGVHLLERLQSRGVPCYQVDDKILKSLASTVSPQGIVAVVPCPAIEPAGDDWLTLVLDQIRNPDNLGAILRIAAAAGVYQVITSLGSADPYNPKAVRAAMGAHFYVPIRAGLNWSRIKPFLEGKQVLLADVGGQTAYYEVDWTVPTALIIGSEAEGAGDEAVKAAHRIISIPMVGSIESLNAAVAAGIIVFEALRQRTFKKA